MARGKVKHVLIANETVRRATFRRRKASLLKKLEELTSLCGVIACAIIFSAYSADPDVWPSVSQAFLVLESLRSLSPIKQGKNMMDQESFLRTNILKLSDKLEKKRKKNRKIEMEVYVSEGMNDNPSPLKKMNDIMQLVKEEIRSIDHRIMEVANKINCDLE